VIDRLPPAKWKWRRLGTPGSYYLWNGGKNEEDGSYYPAAFIERDPSGSYRVDVNPGIDEKEPKLLGTYPTLKEAKQQGKEYAIAELVIQRLNR